MRLNELRTIILECQAMTDLRFGQWLSNLIGDRDLFYIEDWELANLVKDLTPLNNGLYFDEEYGWRTYPTKKQSVGRKIEVKYIP